MRVSAFFISSCSNWRLVCAAVTSLLVLSHSALCAHHFDRSQTPDLHLFLSIGQSLFGEGQRLILHSRILIVVDQIPVDIFDLIHAVDNLQAESDVGKFTVVLGDMNKTGVRRKAKALQEMLRQPEIKPRVELWAEVAKKLLVVTLVLLKPSVRLVPQLKPCW